MHGFLEGAVAKVLKGLVFYRFPLIIAREKRLACVDFVLLVRIAAHFL